MHIYRIKICNFRLLEDFSIDLEDSLSLVIGKNNTGKTSLVSLLDKFLNQPGASAFTADDFSVGFFEKVKDRIIHLLGNPTEDEEQTKPLGISLTLFIRYDENDNIANISRLFTDLDPANNNVIIRFEYSISNVQLLKAANDFPQLIEGFAAAQEDPGFDAVKEEFIDYLKKKRSKYFEIDKRSLGYNVESQKVNEKVSEKIDSGTDIRKVINLKIIHARRDVSNKDSDKTLSTQSSRYYDKKIALDDEPEELTEFDSALSDTDKKLDVVYEKIFEKVIDKVRRFGGVKHGDSNIRIVSKLDKNNILKGNTTVMYDHQQGYALPENYNGLGYLNLINMIFEIEVILDDFKREDNPRENPSDINILFIEEPEAHTHPQMQYVFIKNIKSILDEGSKGYRLQTVITTHSSHITSESDFDDIKYFVRRSSGGVKAKSLKLLEGLVSDKKRFRFLKQYITLNSSELFFADKAILIEGETERILLPSMMKKLDSQSLAKGKVPLISQNISIVEVGAHSKVFEPLIDFLEIKTLIITDIDPLKSEKVMEKGKERIKRVGCSVADGEDTSNSTLKYFFPSTSFEKLKALSAAKKVFSKAEEGGESKWQPDNKHGNLRIAFQTEENDFHARSFEDAFFSINREFVVDPENNFEGIKLKYLKKYVENEITDEELAEKGIKKKPTFAIDILLNSKDDKKGQQFVNWEIPKYIKEGLTWLQQD